MAYCNNCLFNSFCADVGMEGHCDGFLSKMKSTDICKLCLHLNNNDFTCKLTDEKVSIYYSSCEKFECI